MNTQSSLPKTQNTGRTHSKIETPRLTENTVVSPKNASTNDQEREQNETKFLVRFKDNLELSTNTTRVNLTKQKISTPLSHKFTQLQNNSNESKRSLNILGMKLEDTSQSTSSLPQSSQVDLLNSLNSSYERYSTNLEESQTKSVNPILNALIELVGKKTSQKNSTNTNTAYNICEKSMKMLFSSVSISKCSSDQAFLDLVDIF